MSAGMVVRRTEDRPAGRGKAVVHEVDEIHALGDDCHLCVLLDGIVPPGAPLWFPSPDAANDAVNEAGKDPDRS